MYKLLFFLLLFSLSRSFAGRQQPSVFSIEQGLSNNYIQSADQDRKGYLWFATEHGLNRFDGLRFKAFRKNGQSNSISANELNKVFADKYDDFVWIATQRAGVDLFDMKTGSFRSFTHDPADKKSIVTNDVTDITNDYKGNIWLSTYHGGFDYYNKRTGSFTHYNRTTLKGLVSDHIWCLAEYKNRYVLLGHVNEGLSVFDRQSGKVQNFRHEAKNAESLPANEVTTLYIDKKANVWVGTSRGLVRFKPGEGTFQRMRLRGSILDDKVFAISELSDGRLWVGTERSGVFEINVHADTGELQSVETMLFSRKEYPSNPTVRAILQDRFGNIWLGTYGRGVFFRSQRPAIFKTLSYSNADTGLSNPVAWGLAVDAFSRIWVGTDGGGISVFNHGRRVKLLNRENGNLNDDAVLTAKRDSRNRMWFGTFKGSITVFNGKFERLLLHQSERENADVRCIFEDEHGNVWAGGTEGLYCFGPDLGKRGFFTQQNTEMPFDMVRAIAKDSGGLLWLGSFGQGLAVLDGNMKLVRRFDTYSGFPSNTVNYIFRARDRSMWVATGEGLIRFDRHFKYKVYNEKSGLKNAHIRAIAQDDAGNIWISSLNGLSKFEYKTGRIYNYGQSFGVPGGDFMSGAVARDSTGDLYFGSQNGLCYFNPKDVPSRMSMPQVVINSLRVFDGKAGMDKFTEMPISEEVLLGPGQNTFSVSFNSLDYGTNAIIDYAYRLRGLDDSWYITESEEPVFFRNIPPGNYKLEVRARIRNQDWDAKLIALDIIMQPPFWLSWWAKLSYGVLILISSWFVVRFYKRKLDLESSLSLEQQNNRREQEIHEERIRFFNNVTHELRTPLTLILGPLDDVRDDASLSESQARKVSIIHKSATRLLRMVNQLLEFEKTESHNLQLHVQKANLANAVYEIALKYRELSLGREFDFVFENQLTTETIYFDAEVVGTILENLLSNAFKYTRQGEVKLSLTEGSDTKGGIYTELRVQDTGKGIPESSVKRIFDRYYQEQEDKLISGTGIGLALVKNLVAIHEGEISVRTEQGKGSVFSVRLMTMNEYPQAVHMTVPAEETHPAKSEGNAEQVSVLVVDDITEIGDYIAESFGGHFRVLRAGNGSDALSIALEWNPDIIISDVMMPGMDGFELARRLKDDLRTSHIPLILLTAKAASADRKQGYAIGVDSYLTKPFSAQMLLLRVNNLLEQQKKLARTVGNNPVSENSIPALSPLDNEFVRKISTLIETNIRSADIDVSVIAAELNMSHSTLYRKVKALTGLSVNEFIRKRRLLHAKTLLLTGSYSVSEVSYSVGINSLNYFRQCFKEEFGMTPSETLKKSPGGSHV